MMLSDQRWQIFCLTSIHAKVATGSECGGIFIRRVHHYFFKASISVHLPRLRILWHAWLVCCLFFPRPLSGDSSVPQDALGDTRDWVTLIQHSISQQKRKQNKSTKSLVYIPELVSCQLPFGGHIYTHLLVWLYLFIRRRRLTHRRLTLHHTSAWSKLAVRLSGTLLEESKKQKG